MRLLTDIHISPRTVQFLNEIGHDAIPVVSVMTATSADEEIVAKAIELQRVVLTQYLDFSELVALSGRMEPSIVQIRLTDSRVDNVNRMLELALPALEDAVVSGVIAIVEEFRVRTRALPIHASWNIE